MDRFAGGRTGEGAAPREIGNEAAKQCRGPRGLDMLSGITRPRPPRPVGASASLLTRRGCHAPPWMCKNDGRGGNETDLGEMGDKYRF